MLSRRRFLALTASALPAMARAADLLPADFAADLARIEAKSGGRLGVAMIDMLDGRFAGHRADERFPMCSTFKFLLATAMLSRVATGRDRLDRPLTIPGKPLLGHSPLTGPHAGGKISLGALCQAAIVESDNTAANLLLDRLGGPGELTAFCRSIGDEVTRLDRREPELNESLPDDPRDTTSPMAMAGNLRRILLGDEVLPAPQRDQLTAWMEASVTGRDRLRRDLPAGWRAADKTGANGSHTSNDIAIFWPPDRPPLLVAAYITQCPGPEAKRAAMLAEIGRLVRRAAA